MFFFFFFRLPLRINCNNFRDPLTFHLIPSDQYFYVCNTLACDHGPTIPISFSCILCFEPLGKQIKPSAWMNTVSGNREYIFLVIWMNWPFKTRFTWISWHVRFVNVTLNPEMEAWWLSRPDVHHLWKLCMCWHAPVSLWTLIAP